MWLIWMFVTVKQTHSLFNNRRTTSIVKKKKRKKSHFGPLLSHDLQFWLWPLRQNRHTAQRCSRSHTNVVCLYWKSDQIDLQHVQGVPHLSPSACWWKKPTSFDNDIADPLRSTLGNTTTVGLNIIWPWFCDQKPFWPVTDLYCFVLECVFSRVCWWRAPSRRRTHSWSAALMTVTTKNQDFNGENQVSWMWWEQRRRLSVCRRVCRSASHIFQV